MEIFKPIPNYPNYEVSNTGNVKSLERMVVRENNGSYKKQERILKSSVSPNGYLKVVLCKSGKMETNFIHKIMATSFLSHISNGYEVVVDHINNNKLDNRLDNLQLITHRSNISKSKRGSSKYTGVCWHKHRKKWQANIMQNGKKKYLGYFTDEKEASDAYNLALKSTDVPTNHSNK